MLNAKTYLENLTEIERRLLIDRIQYRLDEAIKDALKSVLAEASALCPFEVSAIDLMRECMPDAIDCYQILDEIEAEA